MEEDKLKHIIIEPNEDMFLKPIRSGRSKFRAPPIEIDRFKEMINKLEKLQYLEVNQRKYVYFMIVLTSEYHIPGVQEMLKKLGVQMISVLDDFRILVKGDKDLLSKFAETENIYLYIRKYILEIKELDNQEKIGESLRKLMQKDVDRKEAFSVVIETMDIEEEEEKKILIDNIEKKIGKDYKFNSKISTFSCLSDSKTIKEISNLPFVKLVSLKPRSKLSLTDYDVKIVDEMKDAKISDITDDNGTICVLDTGVKSDLFSGLISKEDRGIYENAQDLLGHGTMVASVALFGTDLLFKRKKLIPKCRILNFKIAHDDPDVDIEDALISAIEKYKDEVFIYNLSYNYYEIEDNLRISLAEKLDKIIQEANVIVVNSAGNISKPEAKSFINQYPDYLVKFPCYCPAETKSIFSVGSICKKSDAYNVKLSTCTRLTVTPLLIDSEIERRNYIKPDINTFGGNTLLEVEKGQFKCYPDLEFPVLNMDGQIVYDLGTSFAAPLISQALLKLKKQYPQLKNSETFKAILLNHCVIHNCNGQNLFSLLDIDNIGYCSNSVFINFEGITKPHQREEEDRTKNKCECFSIEFDMPPEARSIDLVAVHSNNYKFGKSYKQNTRLVIKVMKGSGKALAKNFGNLGQFSQLLYGTYTFKRNFEGKWKIQVYLETRGIPSEQAKNISIRWGISIKVNFGNISLGELKKMYGIISGVKTETSVKLYPYTSIFHPADMTLKEFIPA